jgi:5-methylcytosine-specific restriction endonuclease McrA
VPHLKREERQEEIRQKKQLQKQRIAELRAVAASANGTSRKLAAKVRNQIAKQHQCPYCGDDLGLAPHADHIYPVSKGGRSVKRNMVYVCAPCNAKKANLTLATFIKTFGLDRNEIEARLTAMEKDF